MIHRLCLVLSILLMPGFSAQAVGVDDDQLEDPALEAKAREIMQGIRCLVCQNEPISSSNAPLAQDLRKIVREQVAAGRSREEIERFLVDRYGDWVLLNPPFKMSTLVLWLFVPGLLALLGFVIWRRNRVRAAGVAEGDAAPLSDEERARLARILDEGEGG